MLSITTIQLSKVDYLATSPKGKIRYTPLLVFLKPSPFSPCLCVLKYLVFSKKRKKKEEKKKVRLMCLLLANYTP